MNVGDVMIRDVVTMSSDRSIRDAIALMQKNHVRHLPIVDDQRLVGIVTDRDIKRATPSLHSGVTREAYEEVLRDTFLFQIMTRDPVTVKPETDLKDAVALLVDSKYGALPVVSGESLAGIICDIDLLRLLRSML